MTGPKVEEVPFELVKLTRTDKIGAPEITPVELNVKGTLKVNWLPKALEAVLPYQSANTVPNCTVTVSAASVVPTVGVNENRALLISRGVEYPVTATVKPVPEALVITIFVITGAPELTV